MSFECGHAYCKCCAFSFKKCPIDQINVNKKKIVKNFGLISLVEENKQKFTELGLDLVSDGIKCKIHLLDRTFFCLQDNVAVCAECALCGDHVGHKIEKIATLRNEGARLTENIGNIEESFRIETFFNPQREFENRVVEITQLKEKTIRSIEAEFEIFLDSVLEEKDRLISQIENVFELATNNLQQFIVEKKSYMEANVELLKQFQDLFSDFQNSKESGNITDIVRLISTHKNTNDQFKRFESGLRAIDRNYRASQIASTVATNIDKVFYETPLTDETSAFFKFNKIDILDSFANSFDKDNPTKLLVRDCPTTLSKAEIKSLISSCGTIRKLKLQKTHDNFNGCFKVAFENEKEAKNFLFFNGLAIGKKNLKIEYNMEGGLKSKSKDDRKHYAKRISGSEGKRRNNSPDSKRSERRDKKDRGLTQFGLARSIYDDD